MSQAGQILVECLRATPPRPVAAPGGLGALDPIAFAGAAAFHKVVAYVRESLGQTPGVDQAVLDALERVYEEQVRTHLRALHDLAKVSARLGRAGVPWLVLKGPVLAMRYPRADLRGYTDLDLVVPGTALNDAVAALDDGGTTMIDRNWELLRRTTPGEVHLRLAHGTTADLHWHLLNRAPLRAAFRVDMVGVFERARQVTTGPVPVATLGRADTVVHLGLHGCLSGGNRIGWLKDIEQCLLSEEPDWDEIVVRAREWRAGLALAAMVIRAQRVLALPVPPGVVRSLAPGRAWRAAVALADRAAPLEHSTGHRSLPRMMALSTRADVRSSLYTLARYAAGWMGEGGVFRRDPPAGPNRDPTSLDSLLHAAGTEGDRAAYFAAVTAESDAANPGR